MQTWEEAIFIVPAHNSAVLPGSRILGASGNGTPEIVDTSSSWAPFRELGGTSISRNISSIYSSDYGHLDGGYFE